MATATKTKADKFRVSAKLKKPNKEFPFGVYHEYGDELHVRRLGDLPDADDKRWGFERAFATFKEAIEYARSDAESELERKQNILEALENDESYEAYRENDYDE